MILMMFFCEAARQPLLENYCRGTSMKIISFIGVKSLKRNSYHILKQKKYMQRMDQRLQFCNDTWAERCCSSRTVSYSLIRRHKRRCVCNPNLGRKKRTPTQESMQNIMFVVWIMFSKMNIQFENKQTDRMLTFCM